MNLFCCHLFFVMLTFNACWKGTFSYTYLAIFYEIWMKDEAVWVLFFNSMIVWHDDCMSTVYCWVGPTMGPLETHQGECHPSTISEVLPSNLDVSLIGWWSWWFLWWFYITYFTLYFIFYIPCRMVICDDQGGNC